jgi:hypothetical protein
VPVQDAGVPLLKFGARFTTFTSSVSVAPKPTGGSVIVETNSEGKAGCAKAADIPVSARKETAIALIMKTSLLVMRSGGRNPAALVIFLIRRDALNPGLPWNSCFGGLQYRP